MTLYRIFPGTEPAAFGGRIPEKYGSMSLYRCKNIEIPHLYYLFKACFVIIFTYGELIFPSLLCVNHKGLICILRNQEVNDYGKIYFAP